MESSRKQIQAPNSNNAAAAPPNAPQTGPNYSSSKRVAIDNNIKMLRHMDAVKYNTIILKSLRPLLNNSVLDKYQKKLLRTYFSLQAVKKEELQACKKIIVSIPRINHLIELMIRNKTYDEANIFRISVKPADVDELEKLIGIGEKIPNFKISANKFNCHHFAALLKKYLFAFDDSLFPSKFLNLYHQLSAVESDEDFLKALQLINMLIPSTNTKILKTIFNLLSLIVNSPKSDVDSLFLARMLYPCLFSSMCFEKKLATSKKKEILKDINMHIDVLARIIVIGTDGFKNAPCVESELMSVYTQTINTNITKKSSLTKNKAWISKHLINNYFEGEHLTETQNNKKDSRISNGSESPNSMPKDGKENFIVKP